MSNPDIVQDLATGCLRKGDTIHVLRHYEATVYADANGQGQGWYEIVAGPAPTTIIGETIPVNGSCHLKAAFGRVTPYHFGVIGDGNTIPVNDTVSLQNFFDYLTVADLSGHDIDWGAEIDQSEPLVFDSANRRIEVEGRLRLNMETLPANTLTAMTFRRTPFSEFDTIDMRDDGSASYAARKVCDAILFEDIGRSIFSHILIDGVKRWGVNHSRSHNNTGNHVQIGRFFNCGTRSRTNADARGVTANITVGPRNGGNGSGSQTVTVTVDALPDHLEEFSHVMIDGKAYELRSASGNTLTIFPWIPLDSNATTLTFINGGGINTISGDSNLFTFNKLDFFGCAKAFKDTALYGACGLISTAQDCTVHLQVADREGGLSPSLGFETNGFYTEGDVDIPVLVGGAFPGTNVNNVCLGVIYGTNETAFQNSGQPLLSEAIPPLPNPQGIYYKKRGNEGEY